jgi:hypothetical protein
VLIGDMEAIVKLSEPLENQIMPETYKITMSTSDGQEN